MVKIMEIPENKWMIWGENPLFSETPMLVSGMYFDQNWYMLTDQNKFGTLGFLPISDRIPTYIEYTWKPIKHQRFINYMYASKYIIIYICHNINPMGLGKNELFFFSWGKIDLHDINLGINWEIIPTFFCDPLTQWHKERFSHSYSCGENLAQFIQMSNHVIWRFVRKTGGKTCEKNCHQKVGRLWRVDRTYTNW